MMLKTVVAGLMMRVHRVPSADGATPELAGPVIGAAVGAFLHGASVRILARCPADLTAADRAFLRILDPIAELQSLSGSPALQWVGPTVVGNDALGRFRGNPTEWRTRVPAHRIDGSVFVAANGDPQWYADILRANRPSFTAMDIHGDWLPFRASELNECLRSADLVTVTEGDLPMLSGLAKSGTRLGHATGPALLVKRGKQGCRLLSHGVEALLPPPTIDALRTDISAGDVLLGALVAELHTSGRDTNLEALIEAYLACLPTLSLFLQSSSMSEFLKRVLNA